jgi:hypothetical protein
MIKGFTDSAFIYCSAEDGCWIAHSLRNDQSRTGIDMAHALVDLIQGFDNVLALADEDDSIAYLREAPADIRERAA